MIRERLEPLSPEAKHQVMVGGAMGFFARVNGRPGWGRCRSPIEMPVASPIDVTLRGLH